jgi:4-hydroxy-3-methylbut-2-enyl diphosphate reductase
VKTLALETEVVFVVGSPNSSNSNRLRELAERCGAKAFLVDHPDQLQREWITGVTRIGVTAGASAPEELVTHVVDRLRAWGGDQPTELVGREENVVFSMPRELR